MKIWTRLFILACALVAAGCASIEPALKANAQPDADTSYISGTFTRKSSGGYAFVLTNLQTKREYGLSLGADTLSPTDAFNQVITIKVPPGRYMVSRWYTYGTLNKAKDSTQQITNPYLSRPFELQARSVMFLGRFLASTIVEEGKKYLSIKPERLTQAEAREAFVAAHPAFAEIGFNCQMCAD
jgi:ABC-type Fe3+-hydroxamate transport system substrate-binding protein